MRAISPIIKAITTEKSSLAQAKKQYAFLVDKASTKVEIKKAIKELYGVDVAKVSVTIYPEKIRLIGKNKIFTKRHSYKKAIVTLKDGKTIDTNKFKDSKKK